MTRKYLVASAILCCPMVPSFSAEVQIDQPQNDKLVMTSTVDVHGKGSPEGAEVRILLNGSSTTTRVEDGRWLFDGLNLNVGANRLDAQNETQVDAVLTVRGADGVKEQPPQKVRFLWPRAWTMS